MKNILILAALFAASIANAQTKAVLKNITGNTLTESLTVGAGKTLTIASGATINAAAGSTVTGFGSGGAWGSITGTLSAQTDLTTALGLKAPSDGATLTNVSIGGIAISDSPGSSLEVTAGTAIVIPSAFGTAAFANYGGDELQLIRWATNANNDAPASILTATALGAVKRNVTALPVNLGGTNATTAAAASNNLLPAQTDHGNHYLRSDGVNVSWDPVDLGQSVQGFLPGTSFPALEGDVTTAAGSLTTTIATGVVGPTQLASTAVTPGSYTATNLTVDADGRITSASNGSSGGGKVLQMVYATKTDTSTGTSSTPSTLMSATITPTSSTSRIVASFTGSGSVTTGYIGWVRISRGSTGITIGDSAGSRVLTNLTYSAPPQAYGQQPLSLHVVDSPETTSATTYNVQFHTESGGTYYLNRSSSDANTASYSRGGATLILTEIAP